MMLRQTTIAAEKVEVGGMVVLEAEEDALGRDRGARQSAIEKSRRPGSWDTWRPSRKSSTVWESR